MEQREFVERVALRAGLNAEQAREAVVATLQTLGERLSEATRDAVAAELHRPLREQLLRRPAEPTFGVEDFWNRVTARTGTRYPDAAHRSRAVLATLREALSPGMWDRLFGSLPADWMHLKDLGKT